MHTQGPVHYALCVELSKINKWCRVMESKKVHQLKIVYTCTCFVCSYLGWSNTRWEDTSLQGEYIHKECTCTQRARYIMLLCQQKSLQDSWISKCPERKKCKYILNMNGQIADRELNCEGCHYSFHTTDDTRSYNVGFWLFLLKGLDIGTILLKVKKRPCWLHWNNIIKEHLDTNW